MTRTYTHPDVLAAAARGEQWADPETDPTRIDWAPRQAAAAIPFQVIDGRPVNPCDPYRNARDWPGASAPPARRGFSPPATTLCPPTSPASTAARCSPRTSTCSRPPCPGRRDDRDDPDPDRRGAGGRARRADPRR